jgi:hypothetical protein
MSIRIDRELLIMASVRAYDLLHKEGIIKKGEIGVILITTDLDKNSILEHGVVNYSSTMQPSETIKALKQIIRQLED